MTVLIQTCRLSTSRLSTSARDRVEPKLLQIYILLYSSQSFWNSFKFIFHKCVFCLDKFTKPRGISFFSGVALYFLCIMETPTACFLFCSTKNYMLYETDTRSNDQTFVDKLAPPINVRPDTENGPARHVGHSCLKQLPCPHGQAYAYTA